MPAVIHALVPYYGSAPRDATWLGECLRSLLAQTRPLQGIVVVDDASPLPPDSVFGEFPSVSLYRNAANTGPFAIDDAAFAGIEADALLLQDSDDYSAPTRLEWLLAAMRRSGADLVGCQMQEIDEDSRPLEGRVSEMPLDPRSALLANPILHPVMLPTSLVSCAFVRGIGGFSSGLRFGADSEFLRRIVLGGRALSIPEVGYFRRIHPRSLTQAPSTGFGSAARVAVQGVVQGHARALVAAALAGEPLDLAPLRRAPLTTLHHVAGPRVPGLG